MNQDNTKLMIEYDSETGEVIREYTIYKKDNSKLNEWRKENKMLGVFKPESRFSKVYQKTIPPYSSRAALGNFHILTLALAPEFNYIGRLTKDKGWLPLTKQEIMELLGMKKTSFYSFLADSYERGILANVTYNDGREYLVVNPIYAFNGRCLNYFVYLAFKENEEFMKSLSKGSLEIIHLIEHEEEQIQFKY